MRIKAASTGPAHMSMTMTGPMSLALCQSMVFSIMLKTLYCGGNVSGHSVTVTTFVMKM